MLLDDGFSHNFSNKQKLITCVIYSLKLCLFSESHFENEDFSCILVTLKKRLNFLFKLVSKMSVWLDDKHYFI